MKWQRACADTQEVAKMERDTTKQSNERVLKRVSLGTGAGALIGLVVGFSATEVKGKLRDRKLRGN